MSEQHRARVLGSLAIGDYPYRVVEKLRLNDGQRRFVDRYSETFNATRSAEDAGYSKKTAASQGSRLLRNVKIRAAIERRLAEVAMSSNEALVRLKKLAEDGDDSVKLSALDKILRASGAYKDRVDVTSGGERIAGVTFVAPAGNE
jgi:hypothetical protein